MSLGSQLSDIFNERTNYDFIGPMRKWFLFSAVLILIGLASLLIRGLNFGIDFEGGTSWQVPAQNNPDTGEIRDLLIDEGLNSPEVVILGGDIIRAQAERVDPDKQGEVAAALARYAEAEAADVSITDVGPTWGADVSDKALRALVVFFFVIAGYLSFRFEPKMALAALSAVVHDILITVGAYSLSGFEVSPATVIAFLTILGFSLYDTVIVFDKVKENVDSLPSGGRGTYSDVVNRSMNSVLMRSLNTSIVSSLPVISLLVVGSYVFGALTLQEFALALTIGIITGAYSSIFIATPLLAVLKEREPRYAAIRHRIAGRGAVPGDSGGAAPAAPEPGDDVEEAAPVGAQSLPRRPGPAPRPRQQRRKRR